MCGLFVSEPLVRQYEYSNRTIHDCTLAIRVDIHVIIEELVRLSSAVQSFRFDYELHFSFSGKFIIRILIETIINDTAEPNNYLRLKHTLTCSTNALCIAVLQMV